MVTLAYQWYHWLTIGTNCTIGRANGIIGITIGTNGITISTIGKTLNDIGIPLGNPEHTLYVPRWVKYESHDRAAPAAPFLPRHKLTYIYVKNGNGTMFIC